MTSVVLLRLFAAARRTFDGDLSDTIDMHRLIEFALAPDDRG